jgi:hypothetical protein
VDINPASQAIEGAVSSGASVIGADKLSAQERIFCDVFITNGGKAGAAARAAGYADASADVTACKLLCRDRVAARIKHLCSTFAHTQLPVAIQTLVEIAGDQTALRKDRIKAAQLLVDMAGLMPKGPLVQVNNNTQVNGGNVQQIINDVWNAKAARMSAIPPAMTDTAQRQLEHDIDSLADPLPATPGGDAISGSPAGSCPTTSVSPHETLEIRVNPEDAEALDEALRNPPEPTEKLKVLMRGSNPFDVGGDDAQ